MKTTKQPEDFQRTLMTEEHNGLCSLLSKLDYGSLLIIKATVATEMLKRNAEFELLMGGETFLQQMRLKVAK